MTRTRGTFVVYTVSRKTCSHVQSLYPSEQQTIIHQISSGELKFHALKLHTERLHLYEKKDWYINKKNFGNKISSNASMW